MLGDVLDHLAGILVQHGIVLHDQEAVVILLQDGHKLEACEGSPDIQLGDIATQATQDAGVVAANEEDFVPLQVEVGIDGIYQHLRWGNQDVEGVFEQGDCWVQFDFHNRIWVALRNMRSEPCVGRM